jgi:hypothetical protein
METTSDAALGRAIRFAAADKISADFVFGVKGSFI